jgi:hypothetical protein
MVAFLSVLLKKLVYPQRSALTVRAMGVRTMHVARQTALKFL